MAQQRRFIHYTPAKGLPAYFVSSVVQDNDGFLWVGTLNGLCRFDGSRFKYYNSRFGDSHSLAFNVVSELYFSRSKELWISTGPTLHRYRKNSDDFIQIEIKGAAGYLRFAGEYGNEMIFCDVRHLYAFNPATLQYRTLPGPPEKLDLQTIHVSLTPSGELFIGTNKGLYHKQHLNAPAINTGHPLDKLKFPVQRCMELPDKRILITTWGAGVWIWNRTNQTNEQIVPKTKSGEKLDITFGLGMFSRDTIAVGLEGGVLLIDKNTTKWELIEPDPANTESIRNGRYETITADAQGNVWIGGTTGLEKWDKLYNAAGRTSAAFNSEPGRNNTVVRLYCDRSGNMYAGSYGGFAVLDKRKNQFRYLLRQQGECFAIAETNRGELYFSQSSEVFSYQSSSGQSTRLFKAKNGFIGGISVINDQTLALAGVGSGLTLLDLRTGKTRNHKTHSDAVWRIATHGEDMLWTYDEGAGYYESATGTTWYIGPTNKFNSPRWILLPATEARISAVCFSQEGNLLLGTRSNGLFTIKKSSHEILNFNPDKGANMLVRGIYRGTHAKIWIASETGIYYWNPANQAFSYYGESAGIARSGLFQSCPNPDGSFWVYEGNELIHLDPEKRKPLPAPQTVFISVESGQRRFNMPGKVKLMLNQSENNVRIDFACLSTTLSDLNTFEYRLSGVHDSWQNNGRTATLIFSSLKPGDYRLEVRSRNAEGMADPSPAILDFHISGPFYTTWWFITLIIFAVVLIITLIYRMKIRRIMELQQVRNRIARDLHDDLGSTLSSIGLLSSIARKNMNQGNAHNTEILQKISQNVQQMQEGISDIVWAVNPENDKPGNLLSRMKSMAVEMLEPANIGFDWECSEAMYRTPIKMDLRRELFLMFKEILNNAIKYSKCSHISIHVEKEGHQLHLCISDNGDGFDKKTIKPGNGLKNICDRASLLHGTCEIQSAPGQGTRISISIPLT